MINYSIAEPHNALHTNGQPIASSTTLAQMPSGSKARVLGFSCDKALRGKLCALGITPGSELDICQSCESICLRVRGCSLVLGSDVASAILCESVSNIQTKTCCFECSNTK